MAAPRRLVLCVEGDGDVAAAPILVKKLLTELQGWDCLFLDPAPIRIGGVTNLFGKKAANWCQKLLVAAKRGNLGGVLLLQDGDTAPLPGQPFCAKEVGASLTERARTTGAGTQFSVSCVFALQEYESWLIAGVESLAGKPLPDGRTGACAPAGDLESAPRNAKGWLSQQMENGYKETTHQEPLTDMVDLTVVRQRNLRSFRRLESALRELIEAIRSGQHIVSPAAPT